MIGKLTAKSGDEWLATDGKTVAIIRKKWLSACCNASTLRISGLEDDARQVEEILHPPLAAVDREAAWAALTRDKKTEGGRPTLVLLEAPGRPSLGVEVESHVVRAALDSLIA